MIKSVGRNGVILGVFALVTTALIGLTFLGTREQIAKQQFELLSRTLNDVMPKTHYVNALIEDCVWVSNPVLHSDKPQRVYRARAAEQAAGFVVETTAPNGYSGNIHMLVGMLLDGTVTGVRVLDHKETPGLGDKIDLRVSDWVLSFTGQKVSPETTDIWEVKKEGGQFDQFTGATITPRAVVNQIEATVLFATENIETLLNAKSDCSIREDSGA